MPEIPMHLLLLVILISAGIALPALGAQITEKTTLYKSDFSTNPDWTTNSPSRYFWDPSLQMYHFKTEGGTNGYSYTPIRYDGQSFVLDYDVILLSSDKNSAFRFGLISSEMDFSRGTNVLSALEKGKYGPIFSLRVIDQSNMLHETSSYYTSYCGEVQGCNTVEFQENLTYHVTVKYNKELQNADIKVTEKKTGNYVWGYFVTIGRDLYFMDRLAITTRGDYTFGPYAEGYIDNVELVAFALVDETPTTTPPTSEIPTRPPTTVPTTPTPTPTAASVSIIPIITAFCVSALLMGWLREKK